MESKKLSNFDGDGSFSGAGKGTDDGITVEFTDTVIRIPDFMFYRGESDDYYEECDTVRIKSVVVGKNVTEIGEYAFYD